MPAPLPATKVKLHRLVAVFSIVAAPLLNAQHFNVLKDFPASGADGGKPVGSGVVAGNKIYGVTRTGGANGMGVLYRMNTDGSQFEKLRDFLPSEGKPSAGGWYAAAYSAIAATTDRLFVALEENQSWSSPSLYSYALSSGSWLPNDATPPRSLIGSPASVGIIDAGNLYGFTPYNNDGPSHGTIFKWNMDANSSAQPIKIFAGGLDGSQCVYLIDGGDKLYGATQRGGAVDSGILFKLNKDGSGFERLHSFDAGTGTWVTGIVLIGGRIYGISADGGSLAPRQGDPNGYLFAINTDGTSYQVVRTYDEDRGFNGPTSIATDGTLLYIGMDSHSSDKWTGGVISSTTNGKVQKTLATFPERNPPTGETPVGIVFQNGRLYGWNHSGGRGGLGTIWSYEPSMVPVKFLPRKRSVAAGKTAKIMAMVSNDTLQTREVTLDFSSSSPDVVVSPKSIKIPVPGKKSAKSPVSFARVSLSVAAGAAVKGDVKIYATDGSFSASPCILTVK